MCWRLPRCPECTTGVTRSAAISSSIPSQTTALTAIAVKNLGRIMRAVMPGRNQSAKRSPTVANPSGSIAPSPDTAGSGAVKNGNANAVLDLDMARNVPRRSFGGNHRDEANLDPLVSRRAGTMRRNIPARREWPS